MTKRGAWPLLTLREMGGCLEADDDMNELNPQLMQLPDLMATSNVLDIPSPGESLGKVSPGILRLKLPDLDMSSVANAQDAGHH